MDMEKWIKATACGDVATIKALLSAGVNVHTRTVNGETGLMRAAANGHAPAVEALLEWGAPVNAWRQDGMTALSLAAFSGHAEVISILLRAGANLHVVDDVGFTAKSWAAAKGYPEVVELLQHAEAAGATQPAPRRAKAAAAAAGPHTQPTPSQRPAEVPSMRPQGQMPAPASAPGLVQDSRRNRVLSAGPPVSEHEKDDGRAPVPSINSAIVNSAAKPAEAPRPALRLAPAEQRPIASVSDNTTGRRGATNQNAWPRALGRALLLFAVATCSTYLVMGIIKSDSRTTQSTKAGEGQGMRPPATVAAPNTVSIANPASPAAPQTPSEPAAGGKLAVVASQVELRRAPVDEAPAELRKVGAAKDKEADTSDAKKTKRSSGYVRVPEVASQEKSGERTSNIEPVLISEDRPAGNSKIESGARSAQGEKVGNQRREGAEARLVEPEAPAPVNPPAKKPTKKVIPWP